MILILGCDNSMALDERKLQVLHAIIQSYIMTAEPIGSRTISKKFDLGVSSATIRNEMSDLEELGYLAQPHTSSGRIPSDKAYRLYVNTMLPILKMQPLFSKEQIDALVSEKEHIENLIENMAKLLSKVTNYTAIAISPQANKSTIKRIQLVAIDEARIMVILVTDSGVVKNKVVKLDEEIDYEELSTMTNFLNEQLKGHTVDEISKYFGEKILKEIYKINSPIIKIVPVIISTLEGTEEVNLYMNGVTNIFNFPEYNDLDRAKEFLSFMENKDELLSMLLDNKEDGINVIIGSENEYQAIKTCSVITTDYSIDGHMIGKIGIIGPTRMDYEKVINTVKSLSRDLNDLINENFF